MLSLNNYPILPLAWNAYVQHCHKTAFQAPGSIFRDSRNRQHRKAYANANNEDNLKKNAPKSSRQAKIQQSLIDRMVSAINLLGVDYQTKIDILTPQSYMTGLSLRASMPMYSQLRTFHVKAERKQDSIPSTSVSDITNFVKNKHKSLNLDSREAMCYAVGMQEGMNMKAKYEREKKPVLTKFLQYSLLILGSCFLYLMIRSSSSLGKTNGVLPNLSKKDYQAEIPDVSFDDVKGIDEVKQELLDVVEFLRDPERFTALGGKLPKGMLLVGPPGTGKTLLARAIAGEAGVPFYFASGSEFDEMFVGVGSARIRNLFSSAKENSPCIIFIDEIDACGSVRSSSPLLPYARQTINQLLQEMDGFSAKESIIILGATNMPEVLDKALTRPGRFDSEINVLPPDIKGRKEILELYSSRIVCGDDLDLERMACLTGGMTGAALSNLVNQAALRAAQLRKNYVEMTDFEYALDKLRLGPELRSRIPTEAELELTAFHEAGHALIAYYTADTMPIYKATIRQRGPALGHVSYIPTKEDETGSTRAKLLAMIDVLMGGRVAEEILKGKDAVTSGASSDLQKATEIAYEFVCTMGMSEGLGFVGYEYKNASAETKRKIELEVRKILEASYLKAKNLLTKHSHQHKLLAKGLLKFETLNLNEIKTLLSTQSMKSVEKLRSSEPAPVSSKPTVSEGESIPTPLTQM